MSPQGYIVIEEAARQLGIGTDVLKKAAEAAGMPNYQTRNGLMYRLADIEKLRRKLAKPGNAASAASEDSKGGEDTETLSDADLEALLGPASGSGSFDPENPDALMFDSDPRVAPLTPKTVVPPTAKPPAPPPGTPIRPAAAPAAPPGAAPGAKPKSSPSVPALAGRHAVVPQSAVKSSGAIPTSPAAAPAPAPAAPPIPREPPGELIIDERHQLFLDSAAIAQMKGVTRSLNQPTKFPGNPIVLPDKPWEQDGLCTLGGTVLYDREEYRYKMWYYAVTKYGRAACYAVSQDGLSWEKPDTGTARGESAGTNIVMVHPTVDSFAELLGVVKDADAEPARRYKAAYVSQNQQTGVRALRTAVSPDGFVWTPLPGQVGPEADVGHFLRDERTGRYVIWGRSMRNGRRSVVRYDSADFAAWTAGELVLSPDERDPDGDDIYGLAAFPYGRGYIGLVQMFHGAPSYSMDVQLAGGHDGFQWERAVNRAVFLPQGRIGEWDRFQLSTAGRPVVVGQRELWFYYGCRLYRHAPYLGADKGPSWGGIGVARMRIDGFAHLEASFDGGTAVTPPLTLKNRQMRINAAAAFGSVTVSLMDGEGKPIPGMTSVPITTDGVEIPVHWPAGANFADHVGKPVRVAFALNNARLYSFWTQ